MRSGLRRPVLLAGAALAISGAAAPPAWLYPMPAASAAAAPPDNTPATLQGSTVTVARRDLRNRELAVDWFPDPADPPPSIVTKASQPGGYACGYCHLARGAGRAENASLAGLGANYIVAQTQAFRNGTRTAASPDWVPSNAMRNAAASANPADIAEAARWFSRQTFTPQVTVVERAMVPPTAPQGFILVVQPGPEQPIAGRIIEVPDDVHAFELRDPRSRFTAWVPPGSIARGRTIAAQIGCISCHAETLNGWGPGRSPSYILRQLLAFKSGARGGASGEPMQAVVGMLAMNQMVDVSAWMAAGARP